MVRERAAPKTGLAAVQAAWEEALGERLAAVATPVSERSGTLTVECADGVWTQELDLMQDQLLERLREVLRRKGHLTDAVFPRFAGLLTLGALGSGALNWYSYGNSPLAPTCVERVSRRRGFLCQPEGPLA
jgi:hypothetical protein